jgi:PKHD-type hydroxylase
MLFPVKANANKKAVVQYASIPLFNDKEIKKIIDKLDDNKWDDSMVYDNKTEEISKHKIRTNKEQPLWPEQGGFPFEMITEEIFNVNSEYWNFDIRYIDFAKDPPLVLKYVLNQEFNWHFDMSGVSSTRKLSFTIQLSDSDDYEGGDLQFGPVIEHKPEIRKKGNITIFPSYVWHRVTPVTKGNRYALVGWVHGPAFK